MRRNKKNDRIKILLLIILGLSLGYALIATTLKINGTSIITKQNWDIYWANPVVTEGSKSMTLPTISQDTDDPLNTKVSWNVTLAEPGDFYEFTIDAVNNGSIDAKIAKINTIVNDDVNELLPIYIKYTVTYSDGTEPSIGDILPKKSNGTPGTKKYKIRVEYDGDYATAEDINNMDDEGIEIKLTYIIAYFQPNITIDPGPVDLKPLLTNIIKNPDNYRNQEQDASNRDIGIDNNGNIINLDWWVDKDECPGTKIYRLEGNGITFGAKDCETAMGYSEGSYTEYSYDALYTMATRGDQVVNGEICQHTSI